MKNSLVCWRKIATNINGAVFHAFYEDIAITKSPLQDGNTINISITDIPINHSMIEPVALQDFFITFFSSALIILAGASYALLFAWSKVNLNVPIKIAAYISYLVLILSVAELTRAAQFHGYWLIISFVMVIGYFFAPIGIWHLCVKTHAETTTTEEKQ